jgi:flotillin
MTFDSLLLAQDFGSGNEGMVRFGVIVALIIGFAAILFFGFIILLVKQYKRCPSNRVLVIYGRTGQGASKTIHGGAAFVVPLIQDYA